MQESWQWIWLLEMRFMLPDEEKDEFYNILTSKVFGKKTV